jgi:uncharacterized delta-60 repeat protein
LIVFQQLRKSHFQKGMKSKIVFLVLICLTWMLNAQSAGDFDPSFATVGHRTVVTSDEVYTYIVQVMQDGRIFSAGMSDAGSGQKIHIYRYLANGDLDTSLAQTGEMIIPGPEVQSDHFDAKVQPDGKILVYYEMPLTNGDGALIVGRLNVDGSMDPGFGNGGWAVDSSYYQGYPSSMVLQADGKMVMTGLTYDTQTSDEGIFAIRLLSNGQLDTGYGNGGTTFVPLTDWVTRGGSSTLQPDGKLLISTEVDSLSPNEDHMAICRLDTDGSLDTGFGNNGVVWVAAGTFDDSAEDLEVGPNGEIYMMGQLANSMPAYTTIVKYDANGMLDTGFGTGGYATFGLPNWGFYGYEMDVQQDGKMVVTGEGPVDNQFNVPFALVRILTNGVQDISFGSINGYTYPAMTYGYNGGYAIDLQPDGNIVVAGTSSDPIIDAMTVARYLGGPVTALEEVNAPVTAMLFPNPTAASTKLRFDLPDDTEVSISVWDIMGREVLKPMSKTNLAQGLNELSLDVNGLDNGTYFVRITAGEAVESLRLVVAD